ncbi:MAG: DNA replication protein DnaC [Candidatus Celerinatantimonas neptuna]|nr:MAG: DNA replication protein DnaC [Candidatus Celerinatantimonas neptuna]
MLNEMINRRLMEQNPTGILTNLDKNSLSDVIDLRVLDRILEGHSMWLTFDWPSYRRLSRGNV